MARKRCHLTQVETAKLMGAGWTQSHIKDVELGYRMPTDENIEKFANIYNTDVVWLKYGGKDIYNIENTKNGKEINILHLTKNKIQSSSVINKIKSNIKTLNDDNLDLLSGLVEALNMDQDETKLEEYNEKRKNDFLEELKNMKK